MKRVLFVLAALSVQPLFAGSPTIVYPTGVFPTDHRNVQAAIDIGGTVLLKATDPAGGPASFNFGPSDFSGSGVNIRGNVTLTGERAGSAMTTILGGWEPVIVEPHSNARIEGINFERSFEAAIFVDSAEGIEITGSRITHVVGRPRPNGVSIGSGLLIQGGGDAIIADNVIDDIDAAHGIGIEQYAASGAVEIVGNTVSGTNTVAIESGGAHAVHIEDNTAIPGPQRYARFASGIGIEGNGPGDFRIERNTVVCVNPFGFGILVFGTTAIPGFQPAIAPVIQKNRVTTDAEAIAIGLIGEVPDAYVGQNTIEGNGLAALVTLSAALNRGDDLFREMFAGNNIVHFHASFADVLFDGPTHDSVLHGFSGTVVDLGTNNRITGFTPMADRERKAIVREPVSGAASPGRR